MTNEAARFERVIVPHLDDAYTLARYLLRDEHDAQDVVQDAVLRALRYFDGFSGEDSRVWLLAVVRNCAMDWHRRHRFDRFAVDIATTEGKGLGAPDVTDAVAIQVSERTRIQRAVAELPTEFREVIVLREIHELPYKEISDIVGVPIGTVMSRLSRARKRLATVLGAPTTEAG